MSLPNYLAKIKSSGIYRFVWDKSEIAGVDAEVLRLVVGYSEKGPFNTPVYIKSAAEFKNVFGDVSKKLERRGVFFHRMALQALEAGPILALNLKKFSTETVTAANFNVVGTAGSTTVGGTESTIQGTTGISVKSIYNTSRFWALDPDQLQKTFGSTNYISLAAADSKETSNSVFMRGKSVKGFDVPLKTWFATQGEDMPAYCEGYENVFVSDFFAEIYVFKGKFTPAIATSEALKKYFDVNETTVTLKECITNAFGEEVDTLTALAADENSGFINAYSGILLPYFKDAQGRYISLDLLFNADNASHHMIMDFNTEALDATPDYIKNLVTTGWNLKIGATSKSILSADGIDPTRVAFTYTTGATGESGGWSSEDSHKCFDPDYYTYQVGSTFNVTDLPHYWKPVVDTFAEGDRFCISTGSNTSDIVTLTEIGTTGTTDAETYNLTFIKRDGSKYNSSIKTLVKLNHSVGETNKNLKPTYFEGYTIDVANGGANATNESGKLAWQQILLGVLTDEPGIRLALTNRVDVDYRYIVDTFEAFIDTEVHKELALIAKEKDNALAFLNFPAAKTFQDHGTQFLDDKNNFQVKYIAEGGNKQHISYPLFTLVSENNGASYASYNTPVVFTDGTVKTVVPAAALVSNNFMQKYLSRQPYYIVAGPNYGRFIATGLVGPDFNYSRADLDILEPMGVNATIYIPRKGTFISSNQTAKQNPVTALSKINVRELVIYLQDEIEKVLQNYQWEFNTQTLRDTVKAKADYICENIKNNGGIYEYINVCDESNNTDDVVNNEMFVLSTSIEPGMGCGKMVQELTIYKKGGMTALIK